MINKNDFLPGRICSFDINNISRQDENGIIFVEILKKLPRKRLFGCRWYLVVGAGSDAIKMKNPVPVPESLLTPASGIVVIRNPSDFPTINSNDIKALDLILDSYVNKTKMTDEESNKMIGRIKALREKLSFSMSLREV